MKDKQITDEDEKRIKVIRNIRNETGVGMLDARKIYNAFGDDIETAKKVARIPAFNIDMAIKIFKNKN